MRVVAYLRVSTDEQAAHGVSLDAQRDKLADYCRLYGHDIVEVVADEGLSGKSLDRPGLRRALAMLKAHAVEGLAVCKLDRLTRSVRDLGGLIETYFSNGHGALLSVGEQIDTATAAGRFMVNVLGSVAQWERETIGERTATALRHKRTKGQAFNHTPLGFDRVDETGSDGKVIKRLVPNVAEQAVVERIKRERSAGVSLGGIAAGLNADGIKGKAGGRFHASTVAKVLSTHPG
jgi:site-specific DNA recombinase